MPRISGIHWSSCCTMLMSEIDRPTSCPVWISSWRAPSSRESDSNSSVRIVVLHVEGHLAAPVAPHVDAEEVRDRAATSRPIASGQTDSVCARR